MKAWISLVALWTLALAKTPLGFECVKNHECESGCCDVSECRESSRCDHLFGVWTIVGIVALLIVVIIVTLCIVASCCGYCTCILCCLKGKCRKRRDESSL